VLDKMADFANASAAVNGKATAANASATSSISASAAPTRAVMAYEALKYYRTAA